MNVLRRKLLREIYRSKGLLLAVTSIIAAGVMCYVSMRSSYLNLRDAKEDYYRRCRMADFWIDMKKAPVAELDVLRSIPGVAEIQSRIQFPVTVDLDGVDRPINGLVVSLPDRRRPMINDIVLRRGGYFTDRRRNEVLVSDAFAREHDLGPGQWVHLLMNNRRQELLIVGTAISSEFTYLIGSGSFVPDPENFGVFYVKRRFAEEAFDFEGAANQAIGRLSPQSPDQVDEVLRRAERRLESFGVSATTPLRRNVSNQFLTNEIRGLGAFAAIIPAIFLAVAALVLNVLVTRLARRQRVVVGTLKALGYSDGRMFLHFLQFGIVVGLVGGVMGGGLGYLSSAGITAVYRLYFNFPELRSGFYWRTQGVGLAVSLICSTLGAWHGAAGVLRLQPAEAMRPAPPPRGGAIWLERFRILWNQLGAGWRTALRSAFRSRVRTTAALFAATMGAALVVAGFEMLESMNFLVDFQFHRISRSDVDLTFVDDRGEDSLTEVRGLPGVDRAEPRLSVACTFAHGPRRRKGGVIGLSPDAWLTTPRNVQGEPIGVPPAGLLMTRRLADILDLKAGDRVTIIPVKGQRRPVSLPVADVAESFAGLEAYADIRYLSRAIDEPLALSGAQLLTDRDPENLARLYRRLKQTPGVESVVSRRRVIENLTEALLANQYVSVGVLIGFAGVIFFGSIVNASLVNLAERQREAATYLALGYGPWRVGGLFLRESLATNVLGAALGMPVGHLLMWLTALYYNNDLLRLPVVTADWIWAATLGIALLFTAAAHLVVQSAISRMDYVSALNVKE